MANTEAAIIMHSETLNPEIKALLSQREKFMAQVFLQYLESLGFNPNNIEEVLELNQSVNGSISQYLEHYKQFLLSEKVDYVELMDKEIDGAFGCLKENGLFISETLRDNPHFFGMYNPKGKHIRPYIVHLPISNYDTSISLGVSDNDNFRPIIENGLDLFIGDIIKRDEFYEDEKKLLLNKLHYKIAVELPSYKIHTDVDSKLDSEFIVLSKK